MKHTGLKILLAVLALAGSVFAENKMYGGEHAAHLARSLQSKMESGTVDGAVDAAKDMYVSYAESKPNAELTKRKVGGKRLKFPINERVLFSSQNCDQVIGDDIIDACYLYNEKISLMVGYELDSRLLASGNIKDRPPFYADVRVPLKYRVDYSDYSGTKLDRGHSRSHASASWDSRSIFKTYSMVNIWGQTPELNREAWLKAERYERQIAHKVGKVNVLNIADINGATKRVGKNKVLVPVGFYKIVYSEEQDYKRCFYYKNTNDYSNSDKLKSHLVDCEKVYY